MIFDRVRAPDVAEPRAPRPTAGPPEDPPRPGLEAAGLRALVVGGVLAGLTQVWMPLQMLIQYMVVLVHEMGHAAAGWLFGFPSIPAFDFMYGGGVTSHGQRSVLVASIVVLLLGFGVWSLRSHPRLAAAAAGGLMLHLLLMATGGDEVVILAMGHGAELGFAALFLVRALTGSGCHLQAERPLYAWLGLHVVLFDLRFAHGLATSAAERRRYGGAKGGGHWMDFSRLAGEIWGVPLETVAVGFALLCLVPLPAALLWARRAPQGRYPEDRPTDDPGALLLGDS